MGVEGLDNMKMEFTNLFMKILPEQQHIVVRKISMEIFSRVVMKTPVDLGRARANWSVRTVKPRPDSDESTDKQPYGSPPPGNMIMAGTMTANNAKPGQAIYITNALPYILKLEEGHSTQGAHMVESTVMEIKSHYGI